MKIFVAGATGVVGWRSVRELVAAGHDVTGLARTDEKAKLLDGLGAKPVAFDVFDPRRRQGPRRRPRRRRQPADAHPAA